jgi:hypothetical protein
MKCTDDDVRRLLSLLVNTEFESKHPRMDMDWYSWIKKVRDDILPLSRAALARLEVTECVAERFYLLQEDPTPEEKQLIAKWRQVAGK